MKNMNKALILMLVLVLTLVCGVGSVAYAAETEQALEATWADATAKLTDATGKEYPSNHQFKDGDPIKFRIDMNLVGSNLVYGNKFQPTKCQHAIREGYHNSWVNYSCPVQWSQLKRIDENTEFTIPFSDFSYLQLQNVPTSKEEARTATNGGLDVFKWWVDQETGTIRLTFTKEALESNQTIGSMYVELDGLLDLSQAQDKDVLDFSAAGNNFELPLANEYNLSKSATLVFNRDAQQYEAQYTVKVNLTRNQDLSKISLGIKDIPGEFIGAPTNIQVSANNGEDVAVQYDADSKTFNFSSNDNVLNKGEYIITYTSLLEGWTKDQLDSDDGSSFNDNSNGEKRKNTAEVMAGGQPTNKKADAWVQYSPLKDKVKVDKGLHNPYEDKKLNGVGVYVENGNYYVDYYLDVKLRTDASEFTVTDEASAYLSFVDGETPTLQYGTDGWDWVDDGKLTAANATLSYTDDWQW